MSLNSRETVIFRTGLPGHGKSYSLAKFLYEVWLTEHEGKVFTNVPINVEKIIELKTKGLPVGKAQVIRSKIQAQVVNIPADWDARFQARTHNPSDYITWWQSLPENHLETEPLRHALVVIDEAGKCWPGGGSKDDEHTLQFVNWLRTLRHTGARICLVMQDEMQVAASIRRLKSMQLHCTKISAQPEPITGATIDHWFQLFARWTGIYRQWIREETWITQGKIIEEGPVSTEIMNPFYYQIYDSHNIVKIDQKEIEATQEKIKQLELLEDYEAAETLKQSLESGEEEALEYKRFGFVKFHLWLMKENFFNWSWRAVVLSVLWLVFCPPTWYGVRAVKYLVHLSSDPQFLNNYITGKNGTQITPQDTKQAETTVNPTNQAQPPPPPIEEKKLVGLTKIKAMYSDGSTEGIGNKDERDPITTIETRSGIVRRRSGATERLPYLSPFGNSVATQSIEQTNPNNPTTIATVPPATPTFGRSYGTINQSLPARVAQPAFGSGGTSAN